MTGFTLAYAVMHGLWRSATEKSGYAIIRLQNFYWFSIFLKIPLQNFIFIIRVIQPEVVYRLVKSIC